MNIRTLALETFLLASLAFPATAATSDWTETPGGRVRIIIEDGDQNNPAINERRGALQIDLHPGWKTYWRNPGDAGVPPHIRTEGDAEAQISFPAPVRFGEEGARGIGYKQPVSLPVVFRLPHGDTRLKGDVFLGICEKICIPVQANFDFSLDQNEPETSPQAIAVHTIINAAFDQIPAAASAAFGISRVKRERDRAIFDLTVPDPAAPAQLFVANDKLRLSDAVAVERRQSGPQFAVQVHGMADNAVIDYTIVQNGKAVSGQVTLD